MSATSQTRGNIGRAVGTTVRVGIGVALVVWLTRSGVIDWAAVKGFADAWPIVTGAMVLLLVATWVTATRLVVLIRHAGMNLTTWAALQLSLVGMFFNLVLPGAAGGDVVRIWFATHGNAGRRAEVVAVLLLDRILGVFALILWPLLVLPFFAAVRVLPAVQALAAAAAAALAAMVVAFAVMFSDRLRESAAVRWVFARLPLGGLAERMVDTVRVYRRRPGALAQAILLALLAHTISIGIMVLLARAVLGEGFNWAVVVLMPLGFLANALPVTPGGLGVGEVVFDSLFRLVGLSQGAAVLIGWRLVSLLPAVMGLAVYLGGRRRFVAESVKTPM